MEEAKVESSVRIQVRLEDDEEAHMLQSIPTCYEELCSYIFKLTGATNFKLKIQDRLVKNTKDLILSYLAHKTDLLEVIVDEEISVQGFMGSSVDSELPSDKFTVENGVISKTDLMTMIAEMTSEAQERLKNYNKEFLAARQQLYGVDEQKWREAAFNQLTQQEKLLFEITGEICRRHSINPEIFQMSCRTHATDINVAQALEEMATNSMGTNNPVPESLTKEKLREVLSYTCDFIETYLRDHPPSHPSEFILLKIREADEVHKVFGFDELEIAAALSKYQIDSSEEWADIRERLANVMKNSLGFDPSMMGL